MLRTTLSTARARSAHLPSSIICSNLTPSTHFQSAARRTFTNSSSSSKPKSSTSFTFSSHGTRPLSFNSTILRRLQQSLRNFHNTKPRFSGATAVNAEPTTLGGKLKKLSREYGWSALGVYFALSALDFPFCYLLVISLGTDRIGRWEEYIISHVKQFIPEPVKRTWNEWRASMRETEHTVTGEEKINEHIDQIQQNVKEAEKADAKESPSNSWFSWGSSSKETGGETKSVGTAPISDAWGVEEAREKVKHDASLATRLALAYAIHKSFIFVRVPLAAAVTPKVVQTLRGWGWDIGKRTTKEAKALKRASMPIKKPRARWAGRLKPRDK